MFDIFFVKKHLDSRLWSLGFLWWLNTHSTVRMTLFARKALYAFKIASLLLNKDALCIYNIESTLPRSKLIAYASNACARCDPIMSWWFEWLQSSNRHCCCCYESQLSLSILLDVVMRRNNGGVFIWQVFPLPSSLHSHNSCISLLHFFVEIFQEAVSHIRRVCVVPALIQACNFRHFIKAAMCTCIVCNVCSIDPL